MRWDPKTAVPLRASFVLWPRSRQHQDPFPARLARGNQLHRVSASQHVLRGDTKKAAPTPATVPAARWDHFDVVLRSASLSMFDSRVTPVLLVSILSSVSLRLLLPTGYFVFSSSNICNVLSSISSLGYRPAVVLWREMFLSSSSVKRSKCTGLQFQNGRRHSIAGACARLLSFLIILS